MTEMNTAALPENIEDLIRDKADEVSRIVEAFLPEITGFPKTAVWRNIGCGEAVYGSHRDDTYILADT